MAVARAIRHRPFALFMTSANSRASMDSSPVVKLRRMKLTVNVTSAVRLFLHHLDPDIVERHAERRGPRLQPLRHPDQRVAPFDWRRTVAQIDDGVLGERAAELHGVRDSAQTVRRTGVEVIGERRERRTDLPLIAGVGSRATRDSPRRPRRAG